MPARNRFHDAVVAALIADGWTITDDPLTLSYGGRDMFVDIGAERPTIGAERAGRRIAVEIQSFLNPSAIYDRPAFSWTGSGFTRGWSAGTELDGQR